jgi:two-component system nitrogen regulation response regulator GlnG
MAVRVVASTCRSLGEVQGFRADLAHRLTVMTLAMPALADHPGDLPLLTAHLLTRLATRLGRPLALTEAGLDRLVPHTWPGNVRELKHVLEEAAAVAPGGVIDAEHLRLPDAGVAPPAVGADLRALAETVLDQADKDAHRRWTDLVEAPLLAAALARTRGNQLRAAELLGIHRTTLRKRTQELGLSASRDDGDG